MTERGNMENRKRSNIATRHTPFYWISKNLLRNYTPSWRAILAYNALAYYVNGESGSCENFSLKTLAKLVDVSKDTIIKGLAELEQKNVITRRRRSRKGPSGEKVPLPNLYELVDLNAAHGEPI